MFFQFSFGTSDNSLASRKDLFPRFFRLNPLEITYNRLRAAFVASFPTWHLDVALMYYADRYHEEVRNTYIISSLPPEKLCNLQNIPNLFKSLNRDFKLFDIASIALNCLD